MALFFSFPIQSALRLNTIKFDVNNKWMLAISYFRGWLNDYKENKIISNIIKEIDDADVINAIRYHTTGRANMSLLEKVIYIADAVEPNRSYPGVNDLRRVVKEDLDKAILLSLSRTIL